VIASESSPHEKPIARREYIMKASELKQRLKKDKALSPASNAMALMKR